MKHETLLQHGLFTFYTWRGAMILASRVFGLFVKKCESRKLPKIAICQKGLSIVCACCSARASTCKPEKNIIHSIWFLLLVLPNGMQHTDPNVVTITFINHHNACNIHHSKHFTEQTFTQRNISNPTIDNELWLKQVSDLAYNRTVSDIQLYLGETSMRVLFAFSMLVQGP